MNETNLPVAVLEGTTLTQRFGAPEPAVDAVTIAVRPGEVSCLLGGAGAGKTTVVRMLLGLLAPTQGSVRLQGRVVPPESLDVRQSSTFITGSGSLCGSMTALQNLELFTVLGGFVAPRTRADRLNAMRRMGIPERAFDARVRHLSRELVIALWLAVAWLRETPILVLDEPTRGIDTPGAGRLQQHLLAFRDRGQAILLATADVLLASQVADRIVFLKRGRASTERTRTEVLSLSLTELYLDYVGRPQTRVLSEPLRPPRRVQS